LITSGIDKEAKRNRMDWQFCIRGMAILARVANNLSPQEPASFGSAY